MKARTSREAARVAGVVRVHNAKSDEYKMMPLKNGMVPLRVFVPFPPFWPDNFGCLRVKNLAMAYINHFF